MVTIKYYVRAEELISLFVCFYWNDLVCSLFFFHSVSVGQFSITSSASFSKDVPLRFLFVAGVLVLVSFSGV